MPRTATVHLLGGDYAERLNVLYQAAHDARDDDAPRTMAEAHPYDTLSAEYAELKAEALSVATTVELTAVGRKEWRALKAKHPIRSGEGVDAETSKADRLAGVNVETIDDDLVYATVTTPSFNGRDAFDEWADRLSEGEWQALVVKSWELANQARFDPKDLPSSPTTKND